eukprot:842166-Rhodomonas_salina.1
MPKVTRVVKPCRKSTHNSSAGSSSDLVKLTPVKLTPFKLTPFASAKASKSGSVDTLCIDFSA